MNESLNRYFKALPLSDSDLKVLYVHFSTLRKLCDENSDLRAISSYADSHYNRIESYIAARKEK